MESLYFMGQWRPWQPQFSGMSQDPMQPFHTNYQTPIQNSWSAPMPWKTWSPPLAQSAPNWRGYTHGNQTYQQAYLQPYQQPSAYPQYQQNQAPFFQKPNLAPQLGQQPQ